MGVGGLVLGSFMLSGFKVLVRGYESIIFGSQFEIPQCPNSTTFGQF